MVPPYYDLRKSVPFTILQSGLPSLVLAKGLFPRSPPFLRHRKNPRFAFFLVPPAIAGPFPKAMVGPPRAFFFGLGSGLLFFVGGLSALKHRLGL